MGRTVLRLTFRQVLARRSELAANATLYAPSDGPDFGMDTPIVILLDDRRSKHSMHRLNTDDQYLLEVSLIDDVLMALDRALDRPLWLAPLRSQQAGGVSLPRVQLYVDRLLAGEAAPAIRVDGQMIVDGNHRYVAARILGQAPPIQPWAGGRPGGAVPWETLPIDPRSW